MTSADVINVYDVNDDDNHQMTNCGSNNRDRTQSERLDRMYVAEGKRWAEKGQDQSGIGFSVSYDNDMKVQWSHMQTNLNPDDIMPTYEVIPYSLPLLTRKTSREKKSTNE